MVEVSAGFAGPLLTLGVVFGVAGGWLLQPTATRSKRQPSCLIMVEPLGLGVFITRDCSARDSVMQQAEEETRITTSLVTHFYVLVQERKSRKATPMMTRGGFQF